MNIIVNIDVIDTEGFNSNTNRMMNHYDVSFILQQLRSIEVKLVTEIPHPYNINITLIYIYIDE